MPGQQCTGTNRRQAHRKVRDDEDDGEHAGSLMGGGQGHGAAYGSLETGAKANAGDGCPDEK